MARFSRKLWWWPPGILVGILVLAGILLTLPFLLVRTEGFRNWALERTGLATILAGEQRVRIERVARLDPGGLRLEGIRVEKRSPLGWESWFEVGRLEGEWRARDLLRRQIKIDFLSVESVRLDLDRMPSPLFVAASAPPSPRGPVRGELRLPFVECTQVDIGPVELIRDGRRYLGSLRVDDLSGEGSELELLLRRAVFRSVADTIAVSLSGGRVRADLVESLSLDSLFVGSAGLVGRLDARWQAEGAAPPAGLLSGHLLVERLSPKAWNPIARTGLPLTMTDIVTGRVAFQGEIPEEKPPQLWLDLDFRGTLFGLPLDTLLCSAVATPDTADLTHLRIRLGDLRIEGNARWLRAGPSATAALAFGGLDLARLPLTPWETDLPSSSLDGRLAAEVDSIGRRARVRGRLGMLPGTFAGQPVSGFAATILIDPDRILLDELRTDEEPEPSLRARGSFDRATRGIEVDGTLTRFPLEDWIAPWLGIPLEGAASGTATVSGTPDDLELRADAGVRDGRVVEVYVDTLTASRFTGRLSPLHLDGDFEADGLQIYPIALDSLRGTVSIADRIATHVVSWRDTTEISLAARVLPRSVGWVEVDSLRVRPGTAPEVSLDGLMHLDFSRDEVRIDSVRVRSPAGTAWGSGRIFPVGEGSEPFSAQIRGEGIDIGAVADYFGLSSENLRGTADLEVQGVGTVDEPTLAFRGRLQGLMTAGWFWEEVRIAGGSGGGSTVTIDSLRGISRGFLGEIPGLETVGPQPPGPPMLLSIDSLFVDTGLPLPRVLAAGGDSLLPLVRQASIGGALSIESVPMAPILAPVISPRAYRGPRTTFARPLDPMIEVIRVVRASQESASRRRPPGIAGLLFLDLKLGGTGGSPILEADLTAQRPQIYQAWADSVRLRAGYSAGAVTIRDLRMSVGPTVATAEGTIPIALSADPGEVRLLPRPVDIRTRIPGLDLGLASLFTSLIQDPSGVLAGELNIRGTPPRVFPEGDLTVSSGSFRIPGREETFGDVKAVLHLDSLGIHIRDATASLNRTGKVRARGLYRDDSHFDLQATVRDAPVFETGSYRFTVDADLKAGPVPEADTTRPRVTGEVRVREGLLTLDLAKPPPPGVPPFTPWLVDLHVIAPGNLRVSQPAAALDLGEMDLEVSFRWPYWNLSGSVLILDGQYRIFNRSFHVTEGSVDFEDTGEGPHPVLRVQAETTVPGTEEEPPVDVQLMVEGPPDELDVVLTSPSRPDYSEAQLIELLSVGQLSSSEFGSFRSGDPTRQYLSTELLNQVERQLVGELPWADRVTLTGQFGTDEPLRINVRPIVEPQWSLAYAQELSSSPDQEVSLHYRLSNLFFLNAALDREQLDTGVPRDTYSLDLKLRIEY